MPSPLAESVAPIPCSASTSFRFLSARLKAGVVAISFFTPATNDLPFT